MDYVRIVPCLDVKDGRIVKGVRFVDLVDVGDPAENARAYSQAGADNLVFLDITATVEKRKTMMDVVKRVREAATVPFIVGGGIRSIEDIETILSCGADKVSISSAAFRNPRLVTDAARRFGREKLIVAIDADRNPKLPSGYEVYIDGGRTPTGADALDWARKAEELGASEILPTSRATDGTKTGYDIPLTRGIAEAVRVPVIASGGAGKLEHLYRAVVEGKAQAVLAASIFHFGEISIPEAKAYLAGRGIPVRT